MRLWLIGVVVCVMAACDKGDGKGLFGALGGKDAAPAVGSASPPPPPPPPPPAAAPAAVVTPAAAVAASAPPPPVVWKLGDKVEARWRDGRWYPAKIYKVRDSDTWDVIYDDGIVNERWGRAKIRARGAGRAPAGGQSHAGGGQNTANAPCPGPGLTRRCGGVCVNIQEDSNNCGSCGNRCSGGKRCDGHMSCRDAEGNL